MAVPCIIMDAYLAPGSIMTQEMFLNFIDWMDYIYRVPGTYWGDRSPNPCSIDIRWRFRDPQNTSIPVMMPVDGPIIQPFTVPCCVLFDQLPEDIQSGLNNRPNGPGPWGETNNTDIAVYFTNGPLLDGRPGAITPPGGITGNPVFTANGTGIIIANPEPGFDFAGTILSHELGHLLIGNDHSTDSNNVMSVPSTWASYRITDDQCTTISGNTEYDQQCED